MSLSPVAGEFRCRLLPPLLLHPEVSSRESVATTTRLKSSRLELMCRGIGYSPWKAGLMSRGQMDQPCADALYEKQRALSTEVKCRFIFARRTLGLSS